MSYLSTGEAYEYNDLACWYQNSIVETQPPIWTDEHLEELLNDFYIIPKDTLTADVVPKSEVERLQEEADRYKRYFFRHDYDEMIAEVLDKLDRFINSNCIEIKDERGIKGYVTSGVHFAIAEFKKKYTEGKQ